MSPPAQHFSSPPAQHFSFSLAMRCHRHNQASTGAKHRCEPCIAVGDGGTAVADSGGPSWTGFSASSNNNSLFNFQTVKRRMITINFVLTNTHTHTHTHTQSIN